jgi:hypothetical protein
MVASLPDHASDANRMARRVNGRVGFMLQRKTGGDGGSARV